MFEVPSPDGSGILLSRRAKDTAHSRFPAPGFIYFRLTIRSNVVFSL